MRLLHLDYICNACILGFSMKFTKFTKVQCLCKQVCQINEKSITMVCLFHIRKYNNSLMNLPFILCIAELGIKSLWHLRAFSKIEQESQLFHFRYNITLIDWLSVCHEYLITLETRVSLELCPWETFISWAIKPSWHTLNQSKSIQ